MRPSLAHVEPRRAVFCSPRVKSDPWVINTSTLRPNDPTPVPLALRSKFDAVHVPKPVQPRRPLLDRVVVVVLKLPRKAVRPAPRVQDLRDLPKRPPRRDGSWRKLHRTPHRLVSEVRLRSAIPHRFVTPRRMDGHYKRRARRPVTTAFIMKERGTCREFYRPTADHLARGGEAFSGKHDSTEECASDLALLGSAHVAVI
jgi:hypothetical protein